MSLCKKRYKLLVLDIIKEFILKSSVKATSFDILYDKLINPQYNIGLKKGLIPIYLACVMHHYKKYAVILKNGKEVEITSKLLDSINENPENYELALEEWDISKEDYITSLKEMFSEYVHENELMYNNFEFIVRAMQRWLYQLPKYTKEINSVYENIDNYTPLDKKILKFKNSLKAPEINAREYLFEKLPEIFGYKIFSKNIKADILTAKRLLDDLKVNLIISFENELKELFTEGKYNPKATLPSIMKDWAEQLDSGVFSHIFSISEEQMLNLCVNSTADTIQFIESLARIATGLRIDDWDNVTINTFNIAIRNFKEDIETYNKNLKQKGTRKTEFYKISYVDASGIESFKTFEKAEYSPQAKLLYNDAEAMMQEYGESLSSDEKRQVLVDIISKVLV